MFRKGFVDPFVRNAKNAEEQIAICMRLRSAVFVADPIFYGDFEVQTVRKMVHDNMNDRTRHFLFTTVFSELCTNHTLIYCKSKNFP